MKILVPGTPPAGRTYRGTCPTCRAKVEFTTGEGRFSLGRYAVACPTSGCDGEIVGKAADDLVPLLARGLS